MVKSTRRKSMLVIIIFLILLVAAYIPNINKTGYLQDDWNTLFITEQRGAGSLVDHYSIDRPLRGYFSLLEYRLLNTKLIYYEVFALIWRFLDTVIIFLILMFLWPKKWVINAMICALIIIFPGFHEQTNAFEYQAHLFSRMCLVFSIYLSLIAISTKKNWLKWISVIMALLLAQISYGLMEYYIGLEALRLALIFVYCRNQLKDSRNKKPFFYASLFMINAVAFSVWRLFIFQSRRASVDASGMLSGYQTFFPTLLKDLSALFVNFYRLVVSAYYKPLLVFSKVIPSKEILIGLAIAIPTALVIFFLVRKINSLSMDDQQAKNGYAHTLIAVGLFGSFGALIPIVFGSREITYVFSGDRFSYPGSISASILILGLLSLLNQQFLKEACILGLIILGLLTQYTNDVIFKLNYGQTNATWWQLSWRAPQILKTTLISGNIEYGINDEDYTFWSPANLIYYPAERDLQITAEVLLESTKSTFLSQKVELYTRKTITFARDFHNLLIFTKNKDACLHVIDGKHPEFSAQDSNVIREVGLLSDLDRIDVTPSVAMQPRVDLFGPKPELSWCNFYQTAQLDRQKRDWQSASQTGEQALDAKYSPNDPMEWLVFLQAFAYTDNPHYAEVKEVVLTDTYAASQACSVFSTYTVEISKNQFAEQHSRLINDVCQ